MTETSQRIPKQPLGQDLARSKSFSSGGGCPPIPEGTVGYLAFNPNFGKGGALYEPLLYFSNNPADAIKS